MNLSAEDRRKRYQYMVLMHKCPICSTKDERTLAGGVYCERHAEYYRSYWRKRNAQKAK